MEGEGEERRHGREQESDESDVEVADKLEENEESEADEKSGAWPLASHNARGFALDLAGWPSDWRKGRLAGRLRQGRMHGTVSLCRAFIAEKS